MRSLRHLINEELSLLSENPFQLNSLEADYNAIPIPLQHLVKMLVATYREEMVKPQSRFGSRSEDSVNQRAFRTKDVKKRATRLKQDLNAAVSAAVREVN